MQIVLQKPNLEKIMENFILAQTQQNEEFLNQDIHATPRGQFPGKPQPNPRGQANDVTLRSGTTYDGPVKPALSGSEASKRNFVSTDEVEELEGQKDQEVKDKGEDKDKVIKKLRVEITFTEAINQILSYAKFLKNILTNKHRLDDPKPLECNSIAENKLAKKEKDPESFSIPCILGNRVIDKAFLDLRASVSLKPLAVCRRLNLGELQPTKMSLQLADKYVKYPIGILEYIPIRTGQLYIPTDFMVMDIK
ncbi:uncharacterized protein LOC127102322 [Lathyrus oleraceus]|uniref:uncharacterized protein LOC127102322 n=1 Tax=Pisum sativum TaxID=3888 RepID=UPI0021D10386|nr:uncharacterized protein LOC127102322 [Pisum sativum]